MVKPPLKIDTLNNHLSPYFFEFCTQQHKAYPQFLPVLHNQANINTKMKIPLQLKNVVLLANLYSINDSYLKEITPKFIKDIVLESES